MESVGTRMVDPCWSFLDSEGNSSWKHAEFQFEGETCSFEAGGVSDWPQTIHIHKPYIDVGQLLGDSMWPFWCFLSDFSGVKWPPIWVIERSLGRSWWLTCLLPWGCCQLTENPHFASFALQKCPQHTGRLATSPQKGAEERKFPKILGKSRLVKYYARHWKGWWNITIWPDSYMVDGLKSCTSWEVDMPNMFTKDLEWLNYPNWFPGCWQATQENQCRNLGAFTGVV